VDGVDEMPEAAPEPIELPEDAAWQPSKSITQIVT
jgi:hypothetical protein